MTGGAAASRSWGHGAIQWTPSSVKANVYVHNRAPSHRRVLVSTTTTDAEGRLKQTEVVLEAEGSTPILQLKQALAAQLPNVPAERMRFVVYGAEANDDQQLSEVSPTSPEVHVKMQVRRRGAPPPPPPPVDELDDLRTPPKHDPLAPAAADDPAPPPPLPPPPLGTLHVRTMCGSAKSAALEVSAETEVRELRERVARLPITLKAWHDDPAAPPADDAAKKSPPKDAKPAAGGAEGDGPPVESVVLLGVGDDLEIPKAPAPAADDAAEGGAEAEADADAEAAAAAARAAAAAYAAAQQAGTKFFAGLRLVHLRDGRVLGDYGLQHESVVYFVLEGR